MRKDDAADYTILTSNNTIAGQLVGVEDMSKYMRIQFYSTGLKKDQQDSSASDFDKTASN